MTDLPADNRRLTRLAWPSPAPGMVLSLLWSLVLFHGMGPAVQFAAAQLAAAQLAADDLPLHSVIDQRLMPVAGVTAQPCSDGEFLRRLSLDLVGMPPTADQARAFINNPEPNKRERLVDQLLATPHFFRQMVWTLDLMLLERRTHTNVTTDAWQAWLMGAIRENKPWNLLVREILHADGADPATRPAACFTLDRGTAPHLLTRDIGRIFFGRDLQCAQCHDHPHVDDYLQADYHGLLAFMDPSFPQVLKVGESEQTVRAEKAGRDLPFESVFEKIPHRTGARLPDDVTIEEPFFLPGEEYQVAPADNVKSVPKFSRFHTLAELATNGANAAFNLNIVNRLWAHMFGRGLVHPLDLQHADNPASDPELLQLLADRFVTMNYDMRSFLRELALTKAYQSGFDLPEDALAYAKRAQQEILASESQLAMWQDQASASATAYAEATDAWYAAEALALPANKEFDAARNQYAEARKKHDETQQSLATNESNLAAKQLAATSLQQAVTALEPALQAVPNDQEISAAATQLSAKSQQLAAEIAAHNKTHEELTAALAVATEALQAAQSPLDVSLSKLPPLANAVRAAEHQMVLARRQAAADAGKVIALRRRLLTSRLIAKLPELQQRIDAARLAANERESELAAAKQQFSEYAAVLAEAEASQHAAQSSCEASESQLAAAQATHAHSLEQLTAIEAAYAAAAAASQAIPQDATLTEVVSQLQQRALIAETRSSELQQQVEAAVLAEKTAADNLAGAEQVLAAAISERNQRQKAIDQSQLALTESKLECERQQGEYTTLMRSLSDRWLKDFTISALKPLTPEQLCWSVFRVTGVYDRYWQAEVAEWDKASPLTEEQTQDPAQLAARDIELEQRTFDKLKGFIGTFVTFYGAAAGQPQGDFFSTADQALFAANGGSMLSWIAPAQGNVTERMIQQPDLRLAAEELYLAVLTRLPTEAEAEEVVTYLSARESDKSVAVQELVWGLLNSAEFRFNH